MASIFRDEKQYHNRVLIGQIINIRPEDGIITVRVTTGATYKMVIPLMGLSGPIIDANGDVVRTGARASWMRYMPQDHDIVKVGFGPDNRPEVIGYGTWGDMPTEKGPLGNLGGYSSMAQLRNANPSVGMEGFEPLRPGEWDMRSSGNAYIFGSKFGQLTLAGGGVNLQLVKDQSELNGRSGLYKLESVGASMRFGDTKRQIPGDFQETIPTGAAKEFDLKVSQTVAPSVNNNYFRMRAGDIWDDTGTAQITSDAGANIRFREEAFAGTPLTNTVYLREVDANGNVYETLGATATKQVLTGASLTEFSRTGYLSLDYSSSDSINFSSTEINLDGSATVNLVAPSINLGDSGLEPAVKGQALFQWLSALTVNTPLGPSTPPLNIGAFPSVLSTVVKVG